MPTCDRCQKTFTQKGHLDAHNARKRPCIQVVAPSPPTVDYSAKTREELIVLCKENKVRNYSGKTKSDILGLLQQRAPTEETVPQIPDKICRLNYIGSKFKLLDWISTNIRDKTGWTSFEDKTVADLFAGTGIVSYHFRKHGARVISNDAELYSSVIVHAMTRSNYTEQCGAIILELQSELNENKHVDTVGFVSTHYSPYNGNERMFFTVDNAQRIDYLRIRLETYRDTISNDEYMFLLASLITSADAVSNVPAVYGCFLKNFKAKATKSLTFTPIHTTNILKTPTSNTYNNDVLRTEFLRSFTSDVVYLDPPYNERQYSKNYFPLNIIAKTPTQLTTLKGKTGIPSDCFISPFCKKSEVENAFNTLFRELHTEWIFLSYNSESLISKEKMLEMMAKYGVASVIERDYKRFKSFEYNNDVDIKEYLFCLCKKSHS
jgi:adenine-specific DNA-methyltransferase